MIKNFNKTFFLIVCIIFYSKFAFSKSPPPGTGTADVPANILIMLDNSGSMSWDVNGNERYANSSYVNRPYDVVRDDNGDIYVFSLNTRKITVLDDDGSFNDIQNIIPSENDLMSQDTRKINDPYKRTFSTSYEMKFQNCFSGELEISWAV